jgi:hypothetical protein
MAAINIVAFDGKCPRCQQQTKIEAYFHVFSSYRGGFFSRMFAIGDRVPWWDENDPNYEDGIEPGEPDTEIEDGAVVQTCYSCCSSCKAELFADVWFRDRIIVKCDNIMLGENAIRSSPGAAPD